MTRMVSIDKLIEVAKELFSNDAGTDKQMVGMIVEELAEKAYEEYGNQYYECPHCGRWFKVEVEGK